MTGNATFVQQTQLVMNSIIYSRVLILNMIDED